MSIRWKLNLVVVVTGIALIVAIFTISQFTFTRDFKVLEQQRAIEMAQRAGNALNDRIQNLDTLNHDYAAWDDTYNFVRDPEANQSYIKSNFTETTYINCDLNFIFVIDNTGNILYGQGYDLTANKEIPIPESFIEKLSVPGLLQNTNTQESSSGILQLPEIPLLVSAQPIVTSNGEGPVAGTIIMAQFLDPQVLTDLGKRILLPVTIVAITEDESFIQNNQPILDPSISGDSKIIDSKRISGSVLIRDIGNQPALILSVVIPRDIYSRGIITMRYFIFALIGLVLVATVVINILIGKIITSRVSQVGAYIDDVTEKGEFTKRLPVKGNDELADISKDMNSIIQSLEDSRLALTVKEKNETKLRRMIESSLDGAIITNLGGIITDIYDSKIHLLGYDEKNELIGKKLIDLVIPAERTRFRDNLEEAFVTGNIVEDQVTILKKDGSSFKSELHVIVLKNNETAPIGFVISTYNLSKQKFLEYQESVCY